MVVPSKQPVPRLAVGPPPTGDAEERPSSRLFSLHPSKIAVKSAPACGLRVLRMALRATPDCDLPRHMTAPIGWMVRTGIGPPGIAGRCSDRAAPSPIRLPLVRDLRNQLWLPPMHCVYIKEVREWSERPKETGPEYKRAPVLPQKTLILPADLVDRLHAYAYSHTQTIEDALESLLSDAEDRDVADLSHSRRELSRSKRELRLKLDGHLPASGPFRNRLMSRTAAVHRTWEPREA